MKALQGTEKQGIGVILVRRTSSAGFRVTSTNTGEHIISSYELAHRADQYHPRPHSVDVDAFAQPISLLRAEPRAFWHAAGLAVGHGFPATRRAAGIDVDVCTYSGRPNNGERARLGPFVAAVNGCSFIAGDDGWALLSAAIPARAETAAIRFGKFGSMVSRRL